MCQCIWVCTCESVAVSLTVNMTLCIPHLPPLRAQTPCPLLGFLRFLLFSCTFLLQQSFSSYLSQGEEICCGSSVMEVSRLSEMKLLGICYMRRFSCGGILHSRKATRAPLVWQARERYQEGSQGIFLWFMRSSRARTGKTPSYHM